MKNKYLFITLVVALFGILYWYNMGVEKLDNAIERKLSEVNDLKDIKVSSKESKKSSMAIDKEANLKSNTQDTLTKEDKELEKSFAIQDQLNADWSVSLLKFFVSKEMGMSLKEYYEFREEYSEQYFEAMDDFYESLSDGERRNPTDDPPQIVELKKRYHKELKDKLGFDNYRSFLEMRDRFNEEIFERYPGIHYVEMEF